MGMVGADVDQLRALARALDQAADRLESTGTSTTSLLNGAAWRGPDADRYRSAWRGSSLAQIRAAVAALREAAAAAKRNADDQESTSAARTGGVSGGSVAGAGHSGGIGGGGGGGGLLDPFVDARDFFGANLLWPITVGTALGKFDRLGVLPLVDALGLAGDDRLSDSQRISAAQNSFTDLAGGLIKARGGGVAYLAGVAVAQWGDVVALASQADFSPATIKTVTDYIVTDPGDAFNAAGQAVVNYVPKLFSNLVRW